MTDSFFNFYELFLYQVGARCLETAVHGAVHNVQINLKDIEDTDYCRTMSDKAGQEVYKAEKNCKVVLKTLDDRDC